MCHTCRGFIICTSSGSSEMSGFSRRSFLRIGAIGIGGLGFSLSEVFNHQAPEAKQHSSTIMIYLGGEPQTLDHYELRAKEPKPIAKLMEAELRTAVVVFERASYSMFFVDFPKQRSQQGASNNCHAGGRLPDGFGRFCQYERIEQENRSREESSCIHQRISTDVPILAA